MAFLRRLFTREDQRGPGRDASPGQMLDYLEHERAAAEQALLSRHPVCPECDSDYLRLGAWTSKGQAGWTVSCVNCGLMLERTVEFDYH
jgi:transposase-like protein